jgi:hypothetical protein
MVLGCCLVSRCWLALGLGTASSFQMGSGVAWRADLRDM